MSLHQIKSSVVLLEEGSIDITKEEGFSQQVIDFLDQTVWGTKDTLYEHKKTEDRIANLHDPNLIILRKDGELGVTVVYDHRTLINQGKPCKSYFMRYLSSAEKLRGKGIVGKYGLAIMNLVREVENERTIFYACVESKNIKSFNFVKKVGNKVIAKTKTLAFSRLFPKVQSGVRSVKKNEEDEILNKVKNFYAEHNLVNLSALFKNRNYYILEKEGEIVAGVQAHDANWVIKKLPGHTGKVLVKIIPKLPLIRKIFNPSNFNFLALEGFFFQNVSDLHQLLEGILFLKNRNSTLFWMDETSPLYKEIVRFGNLGLLHRFVKNNSTFIMTSYKNLNQDEIASIEAGPVYVSSFDFI